MRWDKTNIVVMNEVHVCSPYLPENVTGGTPAANERVRKVVRYIQAYMSFAQFLFSTLSYLIHSIYYCE